MRGRQKQDPAGRLAPCFAGVLLAALLPLAGLAAEPPLPVARVELRAVGDRYVADAVIEARQQTTVAAQSAGRILAVHADAGQAVQKGERLATLDPREGDLQFNAAAAQVAAAEARLAEARLNFERTRGLHARNFVSAAALDRARADLDAASAQAEAARAARGQSGVQKGYAQVVAPFAGVIGARLAEAGEVATPGRALFTLFDPAALRVTAQLPQSLLQRVRQGASAHLLLPGEARVALGALSLLPAADPRQLTSRVRADLVGPATPTVVPGLVTKLVIALGGRERLVMPEAAVVRRGEFVGAYVMAGETAQLRMIRVGEALGEGQVEVLAGLAAGDTVSLDPLRAAARTAGSR